MPKRAFIVSLLIVGCIPPEEVLPVAVNLPVRGLWTNPSDDRAPEGSLEVANNVTFAAPGILEPRRGFDESAGTLSGSVNALTYYDGYLIAHHSSGGISRSSDDGANWTAYSGTFSPPDASTRVRFFQAESSLFVLCSDGVYQLDSGTGTWRLTGSPKPLDGAAALNRSTNETGFATSNGQWAYRDVWGYRDANGRLQLSEVSGRVLVQNPASFSATTAQISKANGVTTVAVSGPTHGLATGEYIDVTLGGSETYFAAGRFQVTVSSATAFTYSDAVNNGSGVTQNPGAAITYGFTSRNVTRTASFPTGIITSHFLQVYRSGKSASSTSEPSDSLGLVYEKVLTNLDVSAGSVTITDITPDELRGAELYTSIEGLVANKTQPPLAHDAAVFKSSAFYIDTQGVQSFELQLLSVPSTGDYIEFTDNPQYVSATWVVAIAASTSESLSSGFYKRYTDGSTAMNIANTARSFVRAVNGVSGNTRLWAEYISGDTDPPGRIRVYGRTTTTARFYAWADSNANGQVTYWAPAMFYTSLQSGNLVRAANVVSVTTTTPHGFSVGQQVTLRLLTTEANFASGVKTVATTPSATTFTYAETGVNATGSGTHQFLSGDVRVMSVSIDRTDRIAFSPPNEPWAVPLANEIYATAQGAVGNKLLTLKRLTATRDRLFVWSDAGLFQVTGEYPAFSLSMVEDKLELLAPETAGAIDSRAYGLTDQGWVEVVEVPRIIDTPIADTFQQLRKTAPSALALYAFGVPYDGDRKFLAWVPDASADTQADQAFVFHQDSQDWTRWPIDAKSGFVNPSNDKLYLGLNSGKVWIERKSGTATGNNALDYYQTTASVTINSITGSDVVLASASGVSVGDAIGRSGAYAIVTAISSNTLTVAEDTGLTTGAATIYKKYDATARWLRQNFGEPDLNKLVDRGVLRFRGPGDTANSWYQLALDFATDLSPTFATSQTLTRDSDAPSTVPFGVPTTKQRGTWIQPQVTHAQALRSPRIEGLSLSGRLAGRAGGR